jgi:hypothetical protein
MNERREGAVEPLHIGRGLVRVDVSFASFLCAREKEEEKPMVLGSKTYGFRRQNLWF